MGDASRADIPLPLDGVVAFLTKTSIYQKSIDILKQKLKDLGGTLVPSITKECTHVILMRTPYPSEEEKAVEIDDIRSIYRKVDALEDAAPPQVVFVAWLMASEKEHRRAIEKAYVVPRPDPIVRNFTEALLVGAGKGAGAGEKKAVARKKAAETKAQPKPREAFTYTVDVAHFNSTQAIIQTKDLLGRAGALGPIEEETPRGAEQEEGAGALPDPSPVPIPAFQPIPSPWNQPTPPPTVAPKKRGRAAKTEEAPAATAQGKSKAEAAAAVAPPKEAPSRRSRGRKAEAVLEEEAAGEEKEEEEEEPVARKRQKIATTSTSKPEAAGRGKDKKAGKAGAGVAKDAEKDSGTPGTDKAGVKQGRTEKKVAPPTPWKDQPRPWDQKEVEVERAQMRKRAMESLGQPGPSKGFIALTNVDAAAKDAVKAAVNELRGVRLCAEGNEGGVVTHLLVGDPGRRTLKLLLACCNGAYLLDPLWCVASREMSRWLWEQPFQIKFAWQGVAEQFRKNSEEKRPLPLAGVNVFVAPPGPGVAKDDARFICNRESLCRLAGALGAAVVKTRGKAAVVVVPGDDAGFEGGKKALGKGEGTVVKAEWLCACVEKIDRVPTKEFE